MLPKDNSKLTLFAYSDWLEENNQVELAEAVREEITAGADNKINFYPTMAAFEVGCWRDCMVGWSYQKAGCGLGNHVGGWGGELSAGVSEYKFSVGD